MNTSVDKVFVKKHHPNISRAIIEFNNLDDNSGICAYFGQFMLFVNLIKTSAIPTAGATFTKEGPVILYNWDFIDTLTIEETKFVLLHEVFHILHNHVERGIGYNHEVFNIAADAIINNQIADNFLDNKYVERLEKYALFKNTCAVSIPNNCIALDPEYDGMLVTESYYNWLIEKDKVNFTTIYVDGGCTSMEGNTVYDKQSKEGGFDNSFDEHNIDVNKVTKEELSDSNIESLDPIHPSMRKMRINEILDNLRNRGLETGKVSVVLNNLQKTKRNYIKEIKDNISMLAHGQYKYPSRMKPSRTGIFGLKGYKKYSNAINVVLDTSGSMDNLFELALSTIFKHNIEVNLIQCDVSVKRIDKLKNTYQLKNLNIEGLGGTELMPAISYIKDSPYLSQYNTLILTDGYCDALDLSFMKKVLLIIVDKYNNSNNIPKIVSNTNNYKCIQVTSDDLS